MSKDLSVAREITFKRIEEDLRDSYNADFDINLSKLVFFSDLHKGTKKKNDSFMQNEVACCYAFDHYFKEGFTLVQVGDSEEGWGFKIGKALKKYDSTVLKFERKFFSEPGRYIRLYGNHDIKWRKKVKVENILKPHLTNDIDSELVVKPALKLGEKIVVLHGQQGSLESDILWKVAKGIVRFVTSIFFRTFGRKKKRAAKNPMVRHERDFLLNSWATKNHKLLIAGHTHRFIFGKKHSLSSVYKSLIDLSKKRRDELTDIEKIILDHSLSDMQSDFDELISQIEKDLSDNKLNENCYFNIGAGVYSDGITCIEIDKGTIRLVFWPNNKFKSGMLFDVNSGVKIFDPPERAVLFEDNLKVILSEI